MRAYTSNLLLGICSFMHTYSLKCFPPIILALSALCQLQALASWLTLGTVKLTPTHLYICKYVCICTYECIFVPVCYLYDPDPTQAGFCIHIFCPHDIYIRNKGVQYLNIETRYNSDYTGLPASLKFHWSFRFMNKLIYKCVYMFICIRTSMYIYSIFNACGMDLVVKACSHKT